MVYTEGIEILGHLAHAGLPPSIVVLGHLFPVIGGEAPVLAVLCKGIRRGAGLAVQVEQVGVLPGVCTVAAYPNGKVSLNGHPVQVGIVHGLPELTVQQELEVAVEAHFLGVFVGKGLYLFGAIGGKLLPGLEVRSAVDVPEDAEHGVREEPFRVGIGKGFVGVRGQCGFALSSVIELAEQFQLGTVYGFIVNGGQGLQLLFFGLVGGILAHAGGRQVDKLRVQGKGAHRVVRVGVLPGMGHGGVVDGEQLNHVLPGLHGPVHQVFNIVEFAHAKAVLAAEAEHGNGHAGAPPRLCGELGLQVGDDNLGALGRHFRKEVIGAFFPQADFLGFGVHNHKLVLHGLVHIQGDEPPREGVVTQENHLVPIAQDSALAHNGEGLAAAHLRGGHADAHIAQVRVQALRFTERHAGRAAEDNVAEGRCIEGRIGRAGHPAGTHHNVFLCLRGLEMVGAPLALHYFSVADHLIGEFVAVMKVAAGEHDLPQAAKRIFHGYAALANAQLHAFSPVGMILKLDVDGHSFS